MISQVHYSDLSKVWPFLFDTLISSYLFFLKFILFTYSQLSLYDIISEFYSVTSFSLTYPLQGWSPKFHIPNNVSSSFSLFYSLIILKSHIKTSLISYKYSPYNFYLKTTFSSSFYQNTFFSVYYGRTNIVWCLWLSFLLF